MKIQTQVFFKSLFHKKEEKNVIKTLMVDNLLRCLLSESLSRKRIELKKNILKST